MDTDLNLFYVNFKFNDQGVFTRMPIEESFKSSDRIYEIFNYDTDSTFTRLDRNLTQFL